MQFPENRNKRNRCPDGRIVKLTDDEIFTALVKLQLVENPSALHLEKRFQFYQQLSFYEGFTGRHSIRQATLSDKMQNLFFVCR